MAWVPLFLLWLGIGESSKIALIALGVFFPVYLNLMNAAQSVDRKLVEVGLANGFRGSALVKKIVLPASLPAYLVGLRQGLSLGWMFVVAAEIMGASRGLGYLLIDGQTAGRPAIMIASVIDALGASGSSHSRRGRSRNRPGGNSRYDGVRADAEPPLDRQQCRKGE